MDDSAVARAVIARAVEAVPGFAVAAAVPHAAAARRFLEHGRADVIVLDLELPGTDGLSALPDLLTASAGARVLVCSSSAGEGTAATIQALALGAADTLVKPAAGGLAGRFDGVLRAKLERLLAAGTDTAGGDVSPAPTGETENAFDLVLIGASTGGIHALSSLLRAIPASFRLPILITQHLPTSFMPYFAAQVAVVAGRPCEVATDRLRVRPGQIVVAPGDAHIQCVALPDGGAAVRLSHEPASHGCMPSVDAMFASASRVFGARVLAVVLSGMGRDGAAGARQVAAAGGTVVIQDEKSSVVWGMPGAVFAGGDAHAILSPSMIGRLIGEQRRPL